MKNTYKPENVDWHLYSSIDQDTTGTFGRLQQEDQTCKLSTLNSTLIKMPSVLLFGPTGLIGCGQCD
jgi:hypothetical protein